MVVVHHVVSALESVHVCLVAMCWRTRGMVVSFVDAARTKNQVSRLRGAVENMECIFS